LVSELPILVNLFERETKVQGCQMVYLNTIKIPILVYFGGLGLENVGKFNGHLNI
jgi:hypothetical protein